jgi:hypothetical protein
MAVGWTSVLWTFHAHQAAGLGGGYGYLIAGSGTAPASVGLVQLAKGVLIHPVTIVRVLWSRSVDIYATVATGGFFGAFWPWVIIPIGLVLLENGVNGHGVLFISPSFQSVLVFILVPVGTVALLASLALRYPRAAVVIAVLAALNAIGWGVVWLPQTAPHWLRVSPGAARTLESIARQIPEGDEVVSSQGVVGNFSGRQWIYAVIAPRAIPIHARSVWAIIAPDQGIEQASVPVQAAWVAEMAGPLHAELIVHRDGIWVFRWVPPIGRRSFTIPSSVPSVPAWTAISGAGTVATTGPSANWRAQANGARGYVVAGDYWQERPGTYQATITLAASVGVNVEVWNATSDSLLARRQLPATTGMVAETVPVVLPGLAPQSVYHGVGPFRIVPVTPPIGNQLEIRVWSPGGGPVSVASLELIHARSTP